MVLLILEWRVVPTCTTDKTRDPWRRQKNALQCNRPDDPREKAAVAWLVHGISTALEVNSHVINVEKRRQYVATILKDNLRRDHGLMESDPEDDESDGAEWGQLFS